MGLSNQQVTTLLGMVTSFDTTDELDCDGCFSKVAEFAELFLAEKDIPEAMQAVQTHLEQCLCCKDEFNALLKGLKAIDENE